MNNQEIIDNNKLIAEFMGCEEENGLYHYTTSMDDYKTDNLYFDVSWDWLMPVVEKIKNVDPQFKIKHLSVIVAFDHRLKDAMFIGIKNLYREVVEFIKWYNKQNDDSVSNEGQ